MTAVCAVLTFWEVAVSGGPTCRSSQASNTAATQRLLIATPDTRNEEDEQNTVGETLRAVADTLQQNNYTIRNTVAEISY